MTKKEKAVKILAAYMKGGLPDKLSGRVRYWFSEEEDRQTKDEALEELFFESVREVRNPKPETYESFRRIGRLLGFPMHILEKQDAESPIIRRRKRLGRTLLRAAAVILPLALISGVLFYMNHPEGLPEDLPEEAPPVSRMSVSGPNARELRLEDSTLVWMNRNTIVVHKTEKAVELYGEAYFSVAKQPEEQNFVIDIKHFLVAVVGTSFNIQAYPDANEVVVSLYEGAIDIQGNEMDMRLTEGKELVYDKTTLEYKISSIARGKPEWMRDIINFERKPLAEVFDALEEIYGVSILGSRASYREDFVSLKYEGGADLEDVMFFLSNISGKFTYYITGEKVIVRRIENE